MWRAVVDTHVLVAGMRRRGCVLNGQAVLVTQNVRDFRRASKELGFRVYRPTEFLKILEADES